MGSSPAVAIQDATLPAQLSVRAPLADLSRAVAARGLGSPAIVVIGAVVGLALPLLNDAVLDAAA